MLCDGRESISDQGLLGRSPFPRSEQSRAEQGDADVQEKPAAGNAKSDRQTDLLWKPPAVPAAAAAAVQCPLSLSISLSLRRGGRSDAGHVLLHFAEPGSDVPAPLRVTHLPRGVRGVSCSPGLRQGATGQGTSCPRTGDRPRSRPEPSVPWHKAGTAPEPGRPGHGERRAMK